MTLQFGPLRSTAEVVAFLVFTGAAWFNAIELFSTIFLSFKRWTGRYFYCLIVACFGALVYQICVFLLIFEPTSNSYALLTTLNVGWTCMVTGQSLVLWSRLHLVCRNRIILNAIIWMIVVDGIVFHSVNYSLTMAAIKGGVLDSSNKAFAISEKVTVALFTVQELIISSVYLWETTRILRVGEGFKQNNKHRIQKLLLANIAIICLDITTVTLEFHALFGVWCSFKGFGYTVKLKIEFAILNQLRSSVSSTGRSGYEDTGSQGISLSSRKGKVSTKPHGSQLERNTFDELDDQDAIMRTTHITVQHDKYPGTHADGTHGFAAPQKRSVGTGEHTGDTKAPSEVSSEVEFATKGM